MKICLRTMFSLGTLAMLIVLPAPATAQSAEELAKQTQNPIANLISVPFRGNWDFGLGDRDATGTLLNFQPVVPLAITPSTNVVRRVIMPLSSTTSRAETARRLMSHWR
jgi:glycopeptide antibiotics resistance protein